MTDLVTIRPGLTLEASAAASWQRMEAEHGPLDVNRSTVTRAAQQKVYDAYLAYLNGGPWAPLALSPDKSWHCPPRARAVDTDDDEWVRARPGHGWRFVVDTEKWHAQYFPELDNHRGQAPAGGGGVPLPIPINPQEDDMATLITGGGQSLVVGPHLIGFATPEDVRAVAGAQLLTVSPTTHYNIIQAFQRATAATLPVIVYSDGGNGTVYILEGGDLTMLADPATLAKLTAQGAASITLSEAEVQNLLKQS